MDLESLARGGGRGAYRKLLPFAWMLPTYYAAPPGKPIPMGGAPLVSLPDPDLQARAQRLVNVLYWTAQTQASREGMSDAQILKLFMAPELAFRKGAQAASSATDSGFGGYAEDARYRLAEALYDAIGRSPLFQDWLVVAGSLCSAVPAADAAQASLLNTALVLRGARAQRDAAVPYVLLEKRYRPQPGASDSRRADADQSLGYRYTLDLGQGLDNLVNWDGLTQGFELGLDHAQQTLRNDMNYLGRVLGPNIPAADLQVIASCGMSIVDPSTAVKHGALVALVDGYCSASQDWREPRFQIGRYDEPRGAVAALPAEQFELTELPQHDGYRIDYGLGRYAQLGRRQGVWSAKAAIPLLAG
ncbi:hypothetical protein DX914_09945 [Lysobacter silvisoli]|uniref:Uncharacterized protein n=2 Tax=Lysobacter silvisoli TaxID=2293254 RepID=A0A371K6A1_9GAMM|nr:hypothetical protein DX914_09945 [Lysobacter silvisoli]